MSGNASLKQAPSAKVRTLLMPTMLIASSKLLTPRGSPNWALLAKRKSLAESAGSLAMRSRIWGRLVLSSFRD